MSWETSNRHDELPPGWEKMRQETLTQDNWLCVWPGRWSDRQCLRPATDVDHIRRGNDHRPQNRQSLCGYHHQQKTNQESAEVRREQQAKLSFPTDYPKHPGLK